MGFWRWVEDQLVQWENTRGYDPRPRPRPGEHHHHKEHSMGLTVTSDQPQYPQGGEAIVTVVRGDTAQDGTIVDYPLTFNELSGVEVLDTGDITLEVLVPPGATVIQPEDPSGLLVITQLSDDGTTATFSVVLPQPLAPAADPVVEAEVVVPKAGQITRTASGARQVTG
jgi:hypothetical protein